MMNPLKRYIGGVAEKLKKVNFNKVSTFSETSTIVLQKNAPEEKIKQKTKFSTKDFFSICDQIRSFLRIWYIYCRNP